MTRGLVSRAMTVLVTVLLAAVIPALAQVRYKDRDGVTHWVNSPDDVPEQYRAGTIGREQGRRDADQQAERAHSARQRATADAAMTRGPATAPVTIVEFSDYQ